MTAMVAVGPTGPRSCRWPKRIDASQSDEMAWMQQVAVRSRAGDRKPACAHMMRRRAHAHMGMATPAQLQEMSAAKGVAFERLFLTRMINHHAGAIRMANELNRPRRNRGGSGLNALWSIWSRNRGRRSSG
jgi:uncharacterized protein (DUF305 family)